MAGEKSYYEVFNISAQGANHVSKNIVCQDYSLSEIYKGFAIAMVADGHGGDKYFRSHKGSQYVCDTAINSIKSFLELTCITPKNKKEFLVKSEEYLRQLASNIISDWQTKVKEDWLQFPFTEKERNLLDVTSRSCYDIMDNVTVAYGTTFMTVVAHSDFWFGLQIGDGKCIKINDDNSIGQPIPWDEKCFLNQTTSLCDINAIDNFRYHFELNINKPPIAFFLGSDGVDDSFSNEEQLNAFYEKVLSMYNTHDFEDANNELEDFLPKLSTKGSGDDISIALIKHSHS